jgi:hypothetical protein
MHAYDQRQGADHDDGADNYEAHEGVFGFHGRQHAVIAALLSMMALTQIAPGPVNARLILALWNNWADYARFSRL